MKIIFDSFLSIIISLRSLQYLQIDRNKFYGFHLSLQSSSVHYKLSLRGLISATIFMLMQCWVYFGLNADSEENNCQFDQLLKWQTDFHIYKYNELHSVNCKDEFDHSLPRQAFMSFLFILFDKKFVKSVPENYELILYLYI